MPWYYCFANHGPGHQSNTEHVKYSDKELSRSEKEDLFDDLFGCYDWPIGQIRKVKSLTRTEKEDLEQVYKGRLREAQKMLKVLETTEVQAGLRPKQREKLKRRLRNKKLLEKIQKRNQLETKRKHHEST